MPTSTIGGKSAEVPGWVLAALITAQQLPAAPRYYGQAQTSKEVHGRKKLHPTLNDHYSFEENKVWSQWEPQLENQNLKTQQLILLGEEINSCWLANILWTYR